VRWQNLSSFGCEAVACGQGNQMCLNVRLTFLSVGLCSECLSFSIGYNVWQLPADGEIMRFTVNLPQIYKKTLNSKTATSPAICFKAVLYADL